MRKLNAAYAMLNAARAQLAAVSVVGHLPVRGHVAHAAVALHRDRLLAMPGVLGVGLGLGAGRQPKIAVFLRSETADDRDLGADLDRMRCRVADQSVDVEVVPFGGLTAVPECVPTMGEIDRGADLQAVRLAPGDGIGQLDPATRCTLGAFAVTADETPVAITAMHVVASQELGPGDAEISIVRRASLPTAASRSERSIGAPRPASMPLGYGSMPASRPARTSRRSVRCAAGAGQPIPAISGRECASTAPAVAVWMV